MRPVNITARLMIWLISASLLVGCATTAKYRAMLKQWQGQDINAFTKVWGYPDRQIKAPNGNTVYVYQYRNTTTFPTTTVPGYTRVENTGSNTTVTTVPTYYSGGGTYHYNCTTWVEINKHQKIVQTSFRGNDCVAR